MVLDPEGEVILNGEKSTLKANGVQEGAEGVFLLAPSGHVGNELPFAEEGKKAAVCILNQWSNSGTNSATPEQIGRGGEC